MKAILFAALLTISGALAAQGPIATSAASPPSYSGIEGAGAAAALIYPAAPPIPGTDYVTYNAGNALPGVTTYTQVVTANLQACTATAVLQGDDQASLTINGILIGGTQQYNTPITFKIPVGVFVDGANTVTTAVNNISGQTGIDYLITPSCPAPVTPVSQGTAITLAVGQKLAITLVPLQADGKTYSGAQFLSVNWGIESTPVHCDDQGKGVATLTGLLVSGQPVNAVAFANVQDADGLMHVVSVQYTVNVFPTTPPPATRTASLTISFTPAL